MPRLVAAPRTFAGAFARWLGLLVLADQGENTAEQTQEGAISKRCGVTNWLCGFQAKCDG